MSVPNADLPEEWRDYQLCKTFGWTLTELDEQPAGRCDWLLAIAAEVRKVEADGSDS